MVQAKAKAKPGVKASGTKGKEKSGEPPEKKPRMQDDTPAHEEAGATEHVPPIASAAAAASERPERATAANATDAHLFSEDNGRNQA